MTAAAGTASLGACCSHLSGRDALRFANYMTFRGLSINGFTSPLPLQPTESNRDEGFGKKCHKDVSRRQQSGEEAYGAGKRGKQ